MKKFPSILKPDTTGYDLAESSTDNWSKRGSADCLMEITAFQTYGDGLTQHSGSWCAQFADIADVCASLAVAILADPKADEWKRLTHLLCIGNRACIRAAMGVKFKEGKRLFYSTECDHKVTAADKRHDRRFEEVQSWHDGSPAAVFRMLNSNSYDWIERLMLASRIREEMYELTGSFFIWEDIIPQTADLKDEWKNALQALILALEAVQDLERAECTMSCFRNNAGLNRQETTVA